MSGELLVQNVGPIETLSIPVPVEGGVVVLRGPNGVGKTTAINAAAALLGDKGAQRDLTFRDGTRKGTISLGECSLTVGRSSRRKGELDVTSLAGRIDVSRLVDPGVADPVLADRQRIRTIVSLPAKTTPRTGSRR